MLDPGNQSGHNRRNERRRNSARPASNSMSDLRNMTRLHEVSMRFVQQGDLHGLLDQILDAAIGITGADKGNIQLLDEDGHTLRLAAQRGFSRTFLDFFSRVHKGQAAVRNRLRDWERVTVEDVATESAIRRIARFGGHVVRGLPGSAIHSPAHARWSSCRDIFRPTRELHGGFRRETCASWISWRARRRTSIERFQSDERLRTKAASNCRASWSLRWMRSSARMPSSESFSSIQPLSTSSDARRARRSERSLERFIPSGFALESCRTHAPLSPDGRSQSEVGQGLGRSSGLACRRRGIPHRGFHFADSLGRTALYTVILRDITDRLREEATLRRQAELLHLSHDAIFVWSEDDGIQFWSKGAAQLYGYASSEVLKGSLRSALFKDGFPRPWQQIEAELHERGLWEGEFDRDDQGRPGGDCIFSPSTCLRKRR